MSIITEQLSFQTREGRWLIESINLSLDAGKLHIILGPNGAGKSTLLNLLSGFLTASSGNITVDTKPLSEFSPLQLSLSRAVLPQLDNAALSLTVEEIIALGRYPQLQAEKLGLLEKTSPDIHQQHINKAMQHMDIEKLAPRSYAELSGGEKQRVQIARVLAQNTDILLLDEPTSALDIAHQHQLLNVLKAEVAENKTVVLVLHDINLALRYADSIILLHKGKLVAKGASDTVITKDNMAKVYGVDAEILYQSSIAANQLIIKG